VLIERCVRDGARFRNADQRHHVGTTAEDGVEMVAEDGEAGHFDAELPG
jgi:hypothetical protein